MQRLCWMHRIRLSIWKVESGNVNLYKKNLGYSYLQAIVEDIVPHHKKVGSKVESQLNI